jgi:alkanesulfonate monooxygenase SsuD/methylene tetrahydromethanopterin reductase-like flavin-dependent oxidoreductase (luciferase family)
MTEPQMGGTYQDLLKVARRAEQAGLTSFARSDHYAWTSGAPRPATDAFATLAGLARETETIRLGVLVTPITFRHPAVIAKNVATIDEMSGGRLDLGIGTGWLETEHEGFGIPFPPLRERFEMMEEALGYVRAAFDGAGFEGRHYRLGLDALPRPSGVRLIVGGGGTERTPKLAGRYADEYNHGIAPAAEIGPKVETMRRAAKDAGRDPEKIRVSVMGTMVTGRDEASYRRSLVATAAALDRDPDELDSRWRAAGMPMGSSDEVAAALEHLEVAGVEKYYAQFFDITDLAAIDAGLEVMVSLSG